MNSNVIFMKISVQSNWPLRRPVACLNSGFSSFYRFFNMLLWPDPLITTLSLPSHSMLKIDLG